MSNEVVLCFSGGMDSTALLFELLANGNKVHTLSFFYGQRHKRELEAASAIAKIAGTPFEILDISVVGKHLSGSALTDNRIDVPHGHYSDESMRKTVVPNRNMIFLALAAGYAMSRGANSVAFAAHAGDHAIYPDCRPEFVQSLRNSILLADWRKVELIAPFIELSKSEICRRGLINGSPFSLTWSCYEGGALHCGKCGTCVERKEAFSKNMAQDRTIYA